MPRRGREPKVAIVVGAIACATGLGWLLMIGAEPLGLPSICGGAGFAAGWDGTGFVGLSTRWLVMIMTMMLPCIAPTIVRVARAERDRYGTLTAAIAFTLGYCAVMVAPACGAALWHVLAGQETGQGGVATAALFGLASAFALLRLRFRRSGQLAARTETSFPMRFGLMQGVAGLSSTVSMICLQLAIGLENLAAMASLAIVMLAMSSAVPTYLRVVPFHIER